MTYIFMAEDAACAPTPEWLLLSAGNAVCAGQRYELPQMMRKDKMNVFIGLIVLDVVELRISSEKPRAGGIR